MIRFLIIFFSMIGFAFAGDTSTRHLATFTDEGRTFVLIEKGVTDGLGAPYANVIAVDVASDNWVEDYPKSYRMNESEISEFERRVPDSIGLLNKLMRERIMGLALDDPKLTTMLEGSVETAHRVANQAWELSANKENARFTIHNFLPSDDKAWQLKLETTDFPAGEACYGQTDVMKGYRLTLTNESTGEIKVLNDDSRIPASRGCPMSYSIADVFTHRGEEGLTGMAIVLRMEKPGFEGPDRRMMVVTTQVE